MGHHTLDGSKVGTSSTLKSRKGSAIGVEGNMLGNTGRTNSLFHRVLNPTAFQALKNSTSLLG